jgi:hypothetical protein
MTMILPKSFLIFSPQKLLQKNSLIDAIKMLNYFDALQTQLA